MHNLEDAKCINFLSQVCYVYDVPGVSHTMIQDDQYGSMICNVAMLWLLLTSSLFSLCLKAYSSFLFCMATMQNAQTKIAIVYMREQSCDTRDDMMIPR